MAGGAGAGAGEGAAGAALRLQGQSEGGEEADAAVRAGLAEDGPDCGRESREGRITGAKEHLRVQQKNSEMIEDDSDRGDPN